VRQAERRLAAATAQIGVATADLFPTIHLTGFYGGGAVQPSQLTTSLGLVWGLGPSISCAAVASSDASLIQLQIDVFKALGGGWHNESLRSP